MQPGDIIVLAGDINHSKLDITNEASLMMGELFHGLSALLPVIIIPGNHDFNLSNPDRLDAISPVIKNMRRDNIVYLWDTVRHVHDDIAFYHYSLASNRDAWQGLRRVDSPEVKTHIALYHGVVAGAKTPTGFDSFSDPVSLSMFDGFDMTLLGDIHKFQFLDAKKTIAYPGSLIQQDHGEELEHGFLIWDVDARSAEFVRIENDYAFITLDPATGIPVDIPKHARVRVIHDGDAVALKEYVDSLQATYSLEELKIERPTVVTESKFVEVDDILNSRKRDVQLRLIREYLGDITEDTWTQLVTIHDSVAGRVRDVESGGIGVRWRPIRFEFSNMFSYGENNVIDFSDIRGIVGLFAPNASGKSTLLDSIIYCMFDKCSRTNRAAQVMNNSKSSFTCSFEFIIGETRFLIERNGVRKTDGTVKVDVNFYKFDGDEKISLNGARRDETNKIIRDYLGSYDDFVLTTLSSQSDNRTFIDMTKKERQELLYRFLDIHVFVELFNLAKEDSKTVAAEVKVLNENFAAQLEAVETAIQTSLTDKNNLTVQLLKLETEQDGIQKEIERLYSTIIPIDDSLDVDSISTKLELKRSSIAKFPDVQKSLDIEYAALEERLKDAIAARDEKQKFVVDDSQIKTLEQDIQKILDINREISHLQSKVDVLKTHEYDPNCKYCVQNQFVIDAKNAETRIQALQQTRESILGTNTIDSLQKLKDAVVMAAKEFASLNNTVRSLESELQMFDVKRKSTEKELQLHTELIASLEADLERARGQETHKLKNKEVRAQIDTHNLKMTSLQSELKTIRNSISTARANVDANAIRKSDILKRQEQYYTALKRSELYNLYLSAVNRDGVPYMILKRVLPIIEDEVNEILHGIVDFTFALSVGENEEIDGNIVYGDSLWAMELTSGMERFVLSLAIRCSLVRLSNLPKPNFLAIDEGFGVLDADKLNSIYRFFTFLKQNFDFVLCISHISEMRDYVDALLNIDKINGYSVIREG